MAGVIGLVGGEEFRVGCEDMDREIMQASGQDPSRVVIIPTAAGSGPEACNNSNHTSLLHRRQAPMAEMILESVCFWACAVIPKSEPLLQ